MTLSRQLVPGSGGGGGSAVTVGDGVGGGAGTRGRSARGSGGGPSRVSGAASGRRGAGSPLGPAFRWAGGGCGAGGRRRCVVVVSSAARRADRQHRGCGPSSSIWRIASSRVPAGQARGDLGAFGLAQSSTPSRLAVQLVAGSSTLMSDNSLRAFEAAERDTAAARRSEKRALHAAHDRDRAVVLG